MSGESASYESAGGVIPVLIKEKVVFIGAGVDADVDAVVVVIIEVDVN
ncbi:MAG: hypothetical protein QF535_21545 [Anaerolineales bacterium]|nr:hypothetical protein [Anaerolineales bacterium]